MRVLVHEQCDLYSGYVDTELTFCPGRRRPQDGIDCSVTPLVLWRVMSFAEVRFGLLSIVREPHVGELIDLAFK